MSNDIKKSQRIIEPNLVTSDISYEIVKGQQIYVVNATFSPLLTPCHHWITTPYFVEKGHSISRHVILKIMDLNHSRT